MIQPLRTAHRRAFFLIAVLAPAVVTAALAARPGRPRGRVELRVAAGVMWPSRALVSSVHWEAGKPLLELTVLRSLAVPDPLLYLAPVSAPVSALPADSVLLGPVGSMRYPLPAERGRLVIYSLARHAIVDQADLESAR